MKRLAIVFLGALTLLDGACAPYYAGPPAGTTAVVAEDRRYYVHGPYYWHGGRRYVWVAGHWGHRHGKRVWIHGRYVVRG
jgi:hypothetical protein